MKKSIYTVLAAALLAFGACDDSEDSIITGADADIVSCWAITGDDRIEGTITGDRIDIRLPEDPAGKALQVKFELSERASIKPDPLSVSDWMGEHRFTVTSANGLLSNDYTVSVAIGSDDNRFEGSARLGNQTELDEFAAHGYTSVSSLVLYSDGSRDQIVDLSGLASLREVKAELEIRNIMATDISFPELEAVGNFDMVALTAEKVSLPKLKNVAGRFRIGNNDPGPMPEEHIFLNSIDLSSLESVGRSLVIFFCPALEQLDMPNLKSVGEDLNLVGGKLSSLDFLANLHEVSGNVVLQLALTSLDGFNITTIGEGLEIGLNECESLEPLHVLKSVPYINLSNGLNITSFKGLEQLDLKAVDLKIFPKITSLEYLPVKDGMEHIQLSNLEALTDLKGMEQIETVGSLHLIDCISLPDIDELSNLRSVGSCSFVMLEGLSRLPEFKNLTKTGKFVVSMMKNLTDISGLKHITEMEDLRIDNLLGLPSLTGLEGLTRITGGGLLIGNLPKITNLDALSNLKEVNMLSQQDLITIKMNSELVSYAGMAEVLIKYWNAAGGKFPKVSITENKYNPTYEQLVAGEWVMPE